MNKERMLDVLHMVLDFETRCICGNRSISARDFEYAADLLDWLEGKPIGHYGLLGCCEEEE